MKKILFVLMVTFLSVSTSCISAMAMEDVFEVESETLPVAGEAVETGLDVVVTLKEELGTGKVEPGDTRMTYLARVGASIQVMDDGTAVVTADAIAYDTITNLLVVAELQQQINGQWVTLRTYRYFTGDTYAIIMEECSVSRGYYYRVVNTTTAYAGSNSETRVAETPEWNFFVPGT